MRKKQFRHMGLSPQARGKPRWASGSQGVIGPIPAGTGETSRQLCRTSGDRAYPRRHGGNQRIISWSGIVSGLSPQARGKHRRWHPGSSRNGPIPAGTGETGAIRYTRPSNWAYPRRHGGNWKTSWKTKKPKGLSPQARGKRSIRHLNSCM